MENVIKQLKDKLNLKGLPEDGKYDAFFSDIAKILMNQCYIQKGDAQYQFIEIEFYLFTPTHPYVITYPRETDAGKWFFHQSGVDLTFDSGKNIFGGILLRGIKNLKNGELILGPLNCVNVLWDEFDAFTLSSDDYPKIETSEALINYGIPHCYKRWIPVTLDKRGTKLKYWLDRIPNRNSAFDLKKTENVVFESHYRYILNDAIDFESPIWKKYRAKPKI